jgi:hypothetical protein
MSQLNLDIRDPEEVYLIWKVTDTHDRIPDPLYANEDYCGGFGPPMIDRKRTDESLYGIVKSRAEIDKLRPTLQRIVQEESKESWGIRYEVRFTFASRKFLKV